MIYIANQIIQFFYQLFSKKRNSLFLGIVGFLIFAWTVGFSNPTMTPDYNVYSSVYYYSGLGIKGLSLEKGYMFLSDLGYKSGMNYQTFRFVFALMIMLVLFIGVRRFTKNTSLFVFLYSASVFLLDAIQIRNLATISLVILGYSFLVDPKIKNILVCTILILLSAQFHTIGYLFLLGIPIRFVKDDLIKFSLPFLLGIDLILFITLKIIGIEGISKIISVISLNIGGRTNLVEKISSQYITGTSSVIFLLVFISSALCLIFGNMVILYFKEVSPTEVEKVKVLNIANILAFATLPLLSLAIDYSRIQRNCLLLLIIMIVLLFDTYKKHSQFNYSPTLVVGIASFILVTFSNYLIWGHIFIDAIPYLIMLK